MSQPIRGWHDDLLLSISPKNTNLVKDVKDLISFQISLNIVKRFKRSWKWLSQSEAQAAILFFNRPKKHKFGIGHWDLPVKSCWILFSSFRGEDENVKANQKRGTIFSAHLHFSAEELLLYPRSRRQRQCRRPRRRLHPKNVRANVKVLEF